MRRLFSALLLLALAGAFPALAQPARLTVGLTFMAASTDPAEGNAGWALTSHGVGETLFTVNAEGQLTGLLAESIRREADGSWVVTLRPDRRFADGMPVTAAEVAASLSRTSEKNAAARVSVGRIAATALDARRVHVASERATPVMAAVLAEWPFVVYRLAPEPVFSGPYAVESLRPGDGLSLQPNRHFAGAANRAPVALKRFPDAQTMAVALEAGELDLAFNLPAESLPRLRARSGVTIKSFLVGYQYMMVMNTRRELLADARVRQAIDLGINRVQLAQAVQGGEAATGAFPSGLPFALTAPRPFDLAAANRLLDEAGWPRDGDGRRRKAGQALDLVLVAYPQRADLVTFQPVIRAQLAALGIGIRTRLVDNAGAVGAAGDFDLLLWAQHTAPAGDPGFFLNAAFRTGSGNNFAGFSSPVVDAQLDRLAETGDPAARAALAAEIQRQVFAAAPVAFLLTPAWHVGLGPRLVRYEPWGSDYYVVRADLQPR